MMKLIPTLCLALVLAHSTVVQAAPEDNAAQLNDIRQAITAAQKDLAEKQVAQRKVQQTLAQTKSALAAARRELDDVNRRRQAVWNKLQTLQAKLTQLQADITNTKAQVARLLAGNYKNRQPNAVVLFLKNADANQKSRFLAYTRRINAANDQVMQKLVVQQQELVKQETAINTELARLQKLADEQQEKMRRLGQDNSRAQAASQKLNSDISAQRSQLARLRENEQRLNNVIAGISARQIRQRQAESQARTQAAQQRAAEAAQQNNHDNTRGNLTREDLNLQAQQNNESSNSISNQQGSLPMPVSGRVTGNYGTARATGGTWRGLFISTSPAGVHSIAAGRVSYAAPLAGFGNTIIIDHGSGYMSVYTGLSSISVGNGTQVGARQNIGTSGTLPAGEEGLYFELRYRNQTINPRSWVRG